MARAVIGGLITSTLLTLFVVPVVYTMLDDVTALVTRRKPAQGRHDGQHCRCFRAAMAVELL